MESTYLFPILRLVCLTGSVYLLYLIFLKKKVNGTSSRIYLLSATLLVSAIAFLPQVRAGGTNTANKYLITLPEVILTQEEIATSQPIHFGWIIYFIPVILLCMRFLWSAIKLRTLSKNGQTEKQNGIYITRSEQIRFPFSFGNHVYLPAHMQTQTTEIVIAHEMVHVKHYHTVDILLFEVLKTFAWFNPFYFLIERELRQAHEFTADETVIKNGLSTESYCKALLSCALAGMHVPVNYFKGSQIKTRIYMMNKKQNLGKALVLGVAAVSLMVGISAKSPLLVGKQEKTIQLVAEPDKMPEFPGGNEAMTKFLVETLKYPEKAREAEVEGRVMVRFTIDENGKIVDPKVIRGIGHGCDEEALRTIKAMPNWKPGEKEGKAVATEMVLPIYFKLK